MPTLEITLHHRRYGSEGWPVTVKLSQPDHLIRSREAVFYLDQATQNSLLQLGALDPLAYGTRLGQALFRDTIYRAFSEALVQAQQSDPLRVLLSVEAPELRGYWWGRLCVPVADDRWDFLALNQGTPLSLYLPSPSSRPFPALSQRHLRALVVVANPFDLDTYDLDNFDDVGTVAGIRQALGEIPSTVLAAIEGEQGLPTLDRLGEELTTGHYSLLHLVAHGRVKDHTTQLFLANKYNQVERINGNDFIRTLDHLARGLPHFVFLSTCESARPTDEGALGGLAEELVRKLGLPAVVAMTERITIATANALTGPFYCQLRSHGYVDQALVEACAGLARRPDITVPVLYSRLGGRPLFSDTGEVDPTPEEIETALAALEKLVKARAPVLVSSYTRWATSLRAKLGTQHQDLSPAAQQEWDQALDEINAICEEVLDLNFRALALGQPLPAYDDRCPFPGLLAFEATEREFFFGRQKLAEKLQLRLTRRPFLAVLGNSGSGKSSLVLAGLVPILQDQNPELQMIYLKPGPEPLASLEKALQPARSPYLLVVDQFEELFTLCADEAVRQAFLDQLLALPQAQRSVPSPTAIIITMRADFMGDCTPYPALKEAIQQHIELIAPLTTTELYNAIKQQIEIVGLRFEAGLSQTILEDVQSEPGAMPLLQHALRELWQRRHGRWLRAEEYQAIGGESEEVVAGERRRVSGIKGAIARTADALYESLPEPDQEQARDIFIRLTQVDRASQPGQERRDTRRRIQLKDLTPAGGDPVLTRRLVQRLAGARLVVVTQPAKNEGTQQAEVEVAHEALIRYWPRLQGWLAADQEILRLWEGIQVAAQEWRAGPEEDKVSLLVHRGGRLEDIEELWRQNRLPLNELEADYIEACLALRWAEIAHREAQRDKELEDAKRLAEEQAQRAQDNLRSNKRLRRRVIFLIIAVLAALVATAFAYLAQQRAATEAQVSGSRELAFAALAKLEDDPELSILLARQGRSITTTTEAEGALRQAIQASRVRLTLKHPAPVSSVAFAAIDNKPYLATTTSSGTIHLWDPISGQVIQTWTGHSTPIYDLALSSDGTRLATGGLDSIKLWETASGQPVITLPHPSGAVLSLVFSPDGTHLATAGADGLANVWDTVSGQPVLTLTGHTGPIYGIAFNPEGNRLATASSDTTARVWDALSGQQILTLTHSAPVYKAVFSPDRAHLATTSLDQTAKIWNLAEPQQPELTLRGHAETVYNAVYSPDGQRLATVSFDGDARIWDTTSGQLLQTLSGHTGPVYGVAFSPGGDRLATGSGDSTAKVWQVAAHNGNIIDLAFNLAAGGKQLASASDDRTARIWDPETGQLLHTLTGHTAEVWAVAFSPAEEEHYLATASFDHTAKVWDSESGQLLRTLSGHTGPVSEVTFSPNGQYLATASYDNTARVWQTNTGQPVHTLTGHTDWINQVVFDPGGTRLATASDDHTAIIWNMATGQPSQVLTHTNQVYRVAFHPDGRRLATTGADPTVILWDIESGQPVLTMTGHTQRVFGLAFSPDGRYLATGSDEATARVWDATSGQELFNLPGHSDPVFTVAFSPDGRRLATAGADGMILFHPLDGEGLLAQAQARLTRGWREEECAKYLHQEVCPP